jgi:hypothetical protein
MNIEEQRNAYYIVLTFNLFFTNFSTKFNRVGF